MRYLIYLHTQKSWLCIWSDGLSFAGLFTQDFGCLRKWMDIRIIGTKSCLHRLACTAPGRSRNLLYFCGAGALHLCVREFPEAPMSTADGGGQGRATDKESATAARHCHHHAALPQTVLQVCVCVLSPPPSFSSCCLFLLHLVHCHNFFLHCCVPPPFSSSVSSSSSLSPFFTSLLFPSSSSSFFFCDWFFFLHHFFCSHLLSFHYYFSWYSIALIR